MAIGRFDPCRLFFKENKQGISCDHPPQTDLWERKHPLSPQQSSQSELSCSKASFFWGGTFFSANLWFSVVFFAKSVRVPETNSFWSGSRKSAAYPFESKPIHKILKIHKYVIFSFMAYPHSNKFFGKSPGPSFGLRIVIDLVSRLRVWSSSLRLSGRFIFRISKAFLSNLGLL